MEEKNIYTAEQMDFITEMMNIGAGNAAAALSQILQADVRLQTPRVHIVSDLAGVPDIFPALSAGVTGVNMKLVGDIQGDAYFFVTDELRLSLVLMAERAMMGRNALREAAEINEFNLSVLSEIGNILAGVYLNAVYEFCRLGIYHSVPVLIMDTVRSLFDRLFALKGHETSAVVFVKNEFVISERNIPTWFMLAFCDENINRLMKSIENALVH